MLVINIVKANSDCKVAFRINGVFDCKLLEAELLEFEVPLFELNGVGQEPELRVKPALQVTQTDEEEQV